MNTHAPKVPASWHVPAWVTPQAIALIIAGAVVLLVLLRLTRIMSHLARAAAKAAAPAVAPASAARSSGGRVKLLAAAAAAVGGFVLFERAKNAATAVKAAPAPSPSPTPRPTITQTVAPPAAHPGPQSGLLAHLTAWMDHLTGTDWVLIVLIGAVLTFALVWPLLKRSDS